MDSLCTILGILFVVSLMGHGFWLLVRAVFRIMSEDGSRTESDRWCSGCQVKLKPHEVRCPSCGEMLTGLRNQYAYDLRATRRQILRFRDDGFIDADEAQRLLKMLQAAGDPERAAEFARKPFGTVAGEVEVGADDRVDVEQDSPVESSQPDSTPTPTRQETPPEPAHIAVPPGESGPIMRQLLARTQSARPSKTSAVTAITESHEKKPSERESRSFGELLATFMEDRNIRWGELVSSVLIVGCSIGLVISLWSTLESIPYFPALLFLLVTAAIHGAGLYTLRRWRLKTTSRGLLTIAQLLIPLNFLAAIALSNHGTMRSLSDPLVLGAIAIGCSVFGAISISGSRVLSRPFKWWPLSLAALLPCIAQIVINRTVLTSPSPGMLILLGLIPIVGFVAACVGQLAEARSWSRLTRRRTIQLFRVAGIGTFASLIPLGLLCWKSGNIRGTLSWLSPLISVAAASTLAIGLRIHRDASAKQLSQFRTGGTALSLFSGLLMAACLAVAWPHPGLLIAIGFTNFGILVTLARISGFMSLLVPAIESLALAVLIGTHLAFGTLSGSGEGIAFQALSGGSYTPSLLTVLLLGRSGILLQLATILTLGVAFTLRRQNLDEAARSTTIGGAILLIGSILACGNAALNFGTQTPLDVNLATLGLLIDGVAVLAAAVVFRHAAITSVGSVLILATVSHGLLVNTAVREFLLRFSLTPDHSLVFSLLAHGLVMSLFALACRRWLRTSSTNDKGARSRRDGLLVPAIVTALLTATATLPWIIFAASDTFLTRSGYSVIVTLVWLIGSLALLTRPLLAGTQVTGIATVSLLMLSLCQYRDWWSGRASDPRAVLAVAFGLTLWSGLWMTLRIRFGQSKLGELLETDKAATVDRIVTAATIALTCGIAWTVSGQTLFEPAVVSGSLPGSAPIFIIALFGLLTTAIHIAMSHRAGQQTPAGSVAERSPAADSFWQMTAVTALIAVPAFCTWATSSANPWHGISGYGTSLELWLALPAVIATAFLHLRERSSRIALTGACFCVASLPAALAAALPEHSYAVLGFGLAGLFGAISITAWWTHHEPSGKFAGITRFFVPASLEPSVEPRAITFFATPAAAVSLLYAARTVLSSGQLSESHEPVLSLAAFLTFLVPLVILVAVSVFTGFRRRRAEFVLSGSLVWSAAALLLYLVLAFDRRLAGSDGVLIVQAVQSAGVAAVLYGLGWQLATHRWPMQSEEHPAAEVRGEPIAETVADVDSAPQAVRPPSGRLHTHASYLMPHEWQHRLGKVLALAPAAWATLLIFAQPTHVFASVVGQSQAAGILTVLLSTMLILTARPKPTGRQVVFEVTLTALAVFAFAAISQYEPRPGAAEWRVFHFLSAGWLTTAAIAACATWFAPRWFSNQTETAVSGAARSALGDPGLPDLRATEGRLLPPLEAMFQPLITVCLVVGGSVLLFALRGLFSDPLSPTPASLLCFGTAFVFAVPAIRARRQQWATCSAAISIVALSVPWLRPFLWMATGGSVFHPAQHVVELAVAIATASALTGGFWLAIGIFCQRRFQSVFDPTAQGPSLPRRLTALAIGAGFLGGFLAETLSSATLARTPGNSEYFLPAFAGLASHLSVVLLVALAGLLTATLWVRTARQLALQFFLLPVIGTLCFLDMFDLSQKLTVVSLAAAVLVAASTLLLAFRTKWFPMLEHLGVWNSDQDARTARGWLPIATQILAVIVTWLAIRSSLMDGVRLDRLTPPVCLAVLALLLGLLADLCCSPQEPSSGPQEALSGRLRITALTWLTGAAVLIVWGYSEPGLGGAVWLTRSVRLLEVLGVATFLFAVPGVRFAAAVDRWRASFRLASSIHGFLALAALALVLILEGVFYQKGLGAPVTGLQTAVVAGVLVALAAGLIAMAVNPERDPLNLTEQQRHLYVYAAEALGGLLFLHIYLTMPELFSGHIRPYWPLIVMAIAFAGAAVGEILRRSKHVVLADPLQRTGTLLPLLPALGFWMVTPRSDLAASYSTELFAAGLVYVFLSMWRKSHVHIVLAAVLGNAGLWAMWHELNLELLTRPQLWMIPPALSALFAAHLNRDRLTAAQVSSIRYASVIVIYVSSTGEMFIAGIGENLWLPIILATLSLFGIFAGILLRVRAFLYLGTSFLLLSVVSMVWHAARSLNEVWPWWVFGIATGIGMLALFGVFEKRRNDMLKIVGELRTWE